MKNFSRAVRLALKHRMTLAGSVFCALTVAIFWGGNISVIYPFVEVVFDGRSMPEWIDHQIEGSAESIAQIETNIGESEAQLARASADEQVELSRQLALDQSRLKAEQQAMTRNQWLAPYIHQFLPTDAFMTLLVLIGILVVGTLVKDVFLIGSMVMVARLSALTSLELRTEFYNRVLHLDVISLGSQASGDLMNRFTSDMQSVNGGVETLFGRAIREPLKMAACLIGAAVVCWRLLLLSLIVAPLAAWLIGRLSKSLKRANRRAMEEMSQIYNTLSETTSGIKVVKAFTMERYELRMFRKIARDYYRKTMKIARYNSLISPLNELMGVMMISMAVLAGAYLALNQQTHLFGIRMSDRPLELGSLLLFYGLLAGVSDPARKLSDVFTRLQGAAAASDRVYEVLDRQPKIVDPLEPTPLPRHHDKIEFTGINFGYDPKHLVLKDVHLTIAFGETVAIVGHNGCGKSTLANLIPRFFDPDAGTVKLDGVDLRDARLRDLRKQIGLVTQETLLFDDTVYNNIRYGAPRARREQVIEAAQRAHAHGFIEEDLALGYETTVGPGGNRLSGGQRQRIALARAILRDPPIMILDEATSQIDVESEQLIHKALEQFIRTRTAIIITHRRSTLDLADRIVVMDHGQIIDIGSHDELIGRCGFYQRMCQVDFRRSA